jgi:hypothetical protein
MNRRFFLYEFYVRKVNDKKIPLGVIYNKKILKYNKLVYILIKEYQKKQSNRNIKKKVFE